VAEYEPKFLSLIQGRRIEESFPKTRRITAAFFAAKTNQSTAPPIGRRIPCRKWGNVQIIHLERYGRREQAPLVTHPYKSVSASLDCGFYFAAFFGLPLPSFVLPCELFPFAMIRSLVHLGSPALSASHPGLHYCEPIVAGPIGQLLECPANLGPTVIGFGKLTARKRKRSGPARHRPDRPLGSFLKVVGRG